MKKYINKPFYKMILLCSVIFTIPSCTKDFEGLNVNKGDISDIDLQKDGAEAAFLLPVMMNNIVSTVRQCKHSRIYRQSLMQATWKPQVTSLGM